MMTFDFGPSFIARYLQELGLNYKGKYSKFSFTVLDMNGTEVFCSKYKEDTWVFLEDERRKGKKARMTLNIDCFFDGQHIYSGDVSINFQDLVVTFEHHYND